MHKSVTLTHELACSPRVIVVLANLMSAAGIVNAETVSRVDLAIELDLQQPADKIVLCGWPYRSDADLSIAEAMKDYIGLKCPVLLPKIICQRVSRDTVGDAFFTRILLDQVYGASFISLDVATSGYHVERARQVFAFVFQHRAVISVSGSASQACQLHGESEASSLIAFGETFQGVEPGDLIGIHAALRARHPFYNGKAYPQIGTVAECLQACID